MRCSINLESHGKDEVQAKAKAVPPPPSLPVLSLLRTRSPRPAYPRLNHLSLLKGSLASGPGARTARAVSRLLVRASIFSQPLVRPKSSLSVLDVASRPRNVSLSTRTRLLWRNSRWTRSCAATAPRRPAATSRPPLDLNNTSLRPHQPTPSTPSQQPTRALRIHSRPLAPTVCAKHQEAKPCRVLRDHLAGQRQTRT